MALIVLISLLAMGALYFVLSELETVIAYQREARRAGSGGGSAFEQAREALIAYAVTYRDNNSDQVFGFLPCPDTTGTGQEAASCGSSNQAAVGLLPYKSLGLPDLRDARGDCLWYAVSGSFKNSPKSSANVMNWDTQGQFQVNDGSGAVLTQPGDALGGAAAVIFSPGGPLSGQARSMSASGPCQVDPALVSAYLDGSYDFATDVKITLTQGPKNDASGNPAVNDQLAWITPKEIFDRVVARKDFSNALAATPPGQLNTLLNRIKAVFDKRIQDDIFNGTTTSRPSNFASYVPKPSGIYTGELDPSMDIGVQAQASYANYLTHWAEQFRVGVCDSLSAPCLDINNGGTANCRGALVLGGRMANGRPRAAAQKGSSLSILANYFESGSSTGGLDVLTG